MRRYLPRQGAAARTTEVTMAAASGMVKTLSAAQSG
jgi:hypothetical protein